jgi:hypothetical protein
VNGHVQRQCSERPQIPDCREFETHPTFPPAREFAAKIRIFPRSVSIGCPSVVQKKFFWKNEAKLCPSLLDFLKKQSQTEPKSNPKIETVGPSQVVNPAQLITDWILIFGISLKKLIVEAVVFE